MGNDKNDGFNLRNVGRRVANPVTDSFLSGAADAVKNLSPQTR